MNNTDTIHRHYPKPAADHHLRADVARLADAFDMVDQDIATVQQDNARLAAYLNQHMLLLDALQCKFGEAITDYFFTTHLDKLKQGVQQPPAKQWALADNHLRGIAVNDERVFVSQNNKDEILVYDHTGQRQAVWTGFYHPIGLWVSNDRLYVADKSNRRVQVLDAASGEKLETIFALLAIDLQVHGDTLWIARYSYNKVTAHSLTTGQSREIDTQNLYARALAVSGDCLYVAHNGETDSHQISRYDANTGALIEAWSPGLSNPQGLAVQGEVLAVADCSNHLVRLFNPLTQAPLGDIRVADFKNPTACRFDAKGLWITWLSHGVTYHDLTACYALPLGG